MSQPDYYQLLGVSADASAAELEAAYRRITALFGPDVNPEPFAAKIHAAASEAWRVLSDPVQREAYDRLRSGTAARVDAGWERNGDEAVSSDEYILNDGVVLDVEFHEDSPGEDAWSDRPGHRAEEAPSSKLHHVSEHAFIREKDLLEQALSPQFIIVFIASVLCLWLTPWLCYNVLWPSRGFGMEVASSRSFTMGIALSAAFWTGVLLLDHFRAAKTFLLHTMEGKVITYAVLFVLLYLLAFRYPFVEVPGAADVDWDMVFIGRYSKYPKRPIYDLLRECIPIFYAIVLRTGCRVLERQGVLNHAAEREMGGKAGFEP